METNYTAALNTNFPGEEKIFELKALKTPYVSLPFSVISTSLTEHNTSVPTTASTEASLNGMASPT